MSSSTTRPFGRLRRIAATSPARGTYRRLTAPVRAVAFWTAVVLPSLYLVALASGVDGGELVSLAVLAVVNAVALFLGRGHNAADRA